MADFSGRGVRCRHLGRVPTVRNHSPARRPAKYRNQPDHQLSLCSLFQMRFLWRILYYEEKYPQKQNSLGYLHCLLHEVASLFRSRALRNEQGCLGGFYALSSGCNRATDAISCLSEVSHPFLRTVLAFDCKSSLQLIFCVQ